MRSRRLPTALLTVLCVLAVAVGCSSSYNNDLLRAEQFEHDENYLAALTLYETVIPRIPSTFQRQVSTAHLHAGGCSLKLQRLKEAFEHYQKAVDSDSSNMDARLHLAELLVMGGLPQQALTHLELVLNQQQQNAGALALLGTIEASAGNIKRAIELLVDSLRIDPDRESTSIALAELYNRADDVAQARSVLLRSATANPRSPMSELALGRLEEQEGNSKAAEDAYRHAVKSADSSLTNLRLAQFLERSGHVAEAEQVLRHLDSLQPSSSTALADFQFSAGRPDSALRSYLETLDHRPTTSTKNQSAAASVAARLVEAQLQSQQRLELQPADASTIEQPTSPFTARLLLEKHRQVLDESTIAILETEIALAEGDLSRAEMQSLIARTRAPESAAAHYVRGLVFRRQDRVAEAKEEWNAALMLDSEHVPSRLALATESLEERDLATADQQVSSVVRDEPGNVAALNLYARVLLAQGRFAPARGILNRSLEIDPSALESQVILGDIEMAQRSYGSALIAYQKALIAHPTSVNALQGLLNVYRKGAITRRVLLQMEKVADAPPSSASLMEVAGRLYEEHGWHVDAVRALSRAVEINARRSTAALALSNAYYASGNAAEADHTVVSLPILSTVASSAPAMIEAAKAEKRADDASAISNYESAIRHGEHSGVAANNLAWLYAKNGIKLNRALSLALSAVERNPKNSAMLDTLGVVYLKLRNYSSATSTLLKAVSLSEKKNAVAAPEASHAELYQHLAAAYAGVGLSHEAAAATAKARSPFTR